MKAKVAFYKAEKGNWVDKIIAWWTKSEYSHVELIVNGYWYSTSPRDLKVSKRIIDFHKENWDVVEVEINEQRFSDVYNSTRGATYDWTGILLHEFISLRAENPKKWYCSEWVANVLGYKEFQMSPQELYERVKLDDVAAKRTGCRELL